MKEPKPRKASKRRDSKGSALIDATGPPSKRRAKRWRVSLVILACGAIGSVVAIAVPYTAKSGTITVLNATDLPLMELQIESAGGRLDIPKVAPHSSSIGVLSSSKFAGLLRVRYALRDPDRPGEETFNRVFYKVPPRGLRSMTFSLSEPTKSPLFREVRLEITAITNFSIPGFFDDLRNGRFPGRLTLGNSTTQSQKPLFPGPAGKKP